MMVIMIMMIIIHRQKHAPQAAPKSAIKIIFQFASLLVLS